MLQTARLVTPPPRWTPAVLSVVTTAAPVLTLAEGVRTTPVQAHQCPRGPEVVG